MTAQSEISRRAALASGAAGLGAVAALAAACSGGGTAGAGARPSAKPGQHIAELAAIPVGQAVSAKLDDLTVIVARPTATTAACFSSSCTHEGCTVSPQGDKLFCPCHGSLFAATTGKVLRGPATSPLPGIAVRIDKGAVVTTGTS